MIIKDCKEGIVCDTKSFDTKGKIVTELVTLKMELEKKERAAEPEMVLRPEDLSPDQIYSL